MSLPHDANHDDEELVQYLLGLLSDEAAERLDEASIADDDFAARLRIAETNLIDGYVRGQLTGSTLARFESSYLSSPRRRQNVRLAGDFIRLVDRSVARVERVTWKDRIARPTRLAQVMAAAALVIVVCGVSLFQAVRLRSELTLETSENGAVGRRTEEVQQQRAGEPSAGAAPAEKLAGAHSSVAASPSSSSASGSPEGRRAASQGGIVAVVLLPPTRNAASIPTLAVPTGADRVRFELRLESNDFPSYRVGLKHPATDQILWRSDWIVPRASADQASVSVVVPAKLLGPQHYSLDLTGRGAGGRAEVIGSYTVRIVQP
jgi:hypothetical protein